MIRRPPRSTQGVSSAASDVYKRQVSITVSWKKGLGIVSVPSDGKITESDFKRVVEKTGFKYGEIKKTSNSNNNINEATLFLDKNPGFLTLKTF